MNDRLERAAPYLSAGLKIVLLSAVGVGAVWGLHAAEARKQLEPLYQQHAQFELLNAPEGLRDMILDDLSDLAATPWIDDQLCRRAHDHLRQNGWIKKVNRVGKGRPGVVYVDCEYRQPIALVQYGEFFYMVDGFTVRMPQQYEYDPSWLLIQGVASQPPPPGKKWPGKDITAGIKLANMISEQPYRNQITAILVHNYGGGQDPFSTHIELVTDSNASRILWGSAPGEELEENTAAQKLHILSDNYRRYGRIDAHQPKIDISVYADRFIIPV